MRAPIVPPILVSRVSFLIWALILPAFVEVRAQSPLKPPDLPSEEPFAVATVLRDPAALNGAHDVELSPDGTLAYVAGKGGAFTVVDVTHPAEPEILWFRQDRGYLTDSETVLVGPEAGRVFLGTDDFLSVDVSEPRQGRFDARLREAASIQTINGMARRGNIIVAANKEGLLNAFEVSDPAAPRLAGVLRTREGFGIDYPHDVDLSGPYGVVVDPNKFGAGPGRLALFRLFGGADGAELLPEGEWELTGKLESEVLTGANRVQVGPAGWRGRYAFVGGSYSPAISGGAPMAKGAVVDLADPAAPRLVATVDFPDARGPNGLTLAGPEGRVWFLAGGQTILACDLTDPTQPRPVAVFTSAKAFPTPDDNAHDLVYRDGHLYVTSQGDDALVILRVVDEGLLELLGRGG